MITDRAMLVDLSISVWTARKLDRAVSSEVDVSKGTRARAGNYNKNLLAGTSLLDDVAKVAGEIRTYHYVHTLPWTDSGTRLLPATSFMEYNTWMHDASERFRDAVDNFLHAYPTLISNAAFVMGKLFNRNDYPRVEDIVGKFKFRFAYSPVPEAGDFRVDVEAEAKEALQAQYKNYYEEKLEQAMADAWQRLHDTLAHMSERLDFTNENKKRVFDSLLGNARELCGLLTHLNVTNNPDLEIARRKLLEAMAGLTTETIKTDEPARKELKAKVDAIADLLEI